MPMRMREELQELLDEYRSLTARLDRMNADVSGLTATARSSDGCVTATVNPHGELAGLTIDPALAQRLTTPALSARILEAATLAAAQVRAQVRAAVSDFLPVGLRRVIGSDGTGALARLRPRDPTDVVLRRGER